MNGISCCHSRHNFLSFFLFSVFILTIGGCGGGGGGGSSDSYDYTSQVIYNGVTTEASIDASNAKALAATLFNSDDSNIVLAKDSSSTANPSTFNIRSFTRLISTLHRSNTDQQRIDYASKISVNESLSCDSGLVTLNGELSDNGIGSITLDYLDCRLDGLTISGKALWSIDAYNASSDTPSDSRYTFAKLIISDGMSTFSIGGGFRDQLTTYPYYEIITSNIVSLNHATGETSKTSNLIFVDYYDTSTYPYTVSETISGRIYNAHHGYIQVETLAPFIYDTSTDLYPISGEIILRGAHNSSLSIHAESATETTLSLDADGDAADEAWARIDWLDIGTTSNQNSLPIVNAGAYGTVQIGLPYTLDGTGSSDEDNDLLMYHWEIVSAPTGSQSTLENDSGRTPSLTPDLAGEYVVTLLVRDAYSSSATETVTLTAVTGDPSNELQAWSTFQGSPTHTGYVPLQLDEANFSERWINTFNGNPTLRPVTAADGHVFVSSASIFQDQYLYMLDARSGSIILNKYFGQVYTAGPPAYAANKIYIQTNDLTNSYLWAFAADSLQLIYRTGYSDSGNEHFAPTPYDNSVYIAGGSYNSGTIAYNGNNDNQQWFVPIDYYEHSTPAANETYVFSYAAYNNPKLTVIDRFSGTVAFEISDTNSSGGNWYLDSAPVIARNNHVINIAGGRLVSFDLATRSVGWEVLNNFTGQPSIANGLIYAISNGGVEARNASDGTWQWEWAPASGNVVSNLIVTKNIMFASTENTTYAVNLSTHNTVWSYAAGGELALGDEGALFITTNNGRLIAINVEGDSDGDTLPDWWERKYNYNPDNASDASLDRDNDGLNTLEEYNARSNPEDSDSDDDGLPDGDEVSIYSTNPIASDTDGDGLTDSNEITVTFTSPILSDTDGDGLSDSVEINIHGTNPNLADTDGDGISDEWEVINGLNPLITDASLDPDNDNLSNLQEFVLNTDPADADTDNDGVNDGVEVNILNTDPLEEDTDADRLPDGWEYDNSLDPLLASDAIEDADSDSFSNLSEFFSATDPNNVASYPIPTQWRTFQGDAGYTGYVPINLNANNFNERWTSTFPGNPELHPASAGNGQVFVTTAPNYADQTLFVTNAQSGAVDWQYDFTSAYYISPPAIDNGIVYIQANGGSASELWAFSSNTAEIKFINAYSNEGYHLTATPYGGSVFVGGGYYGGTYSFDGNTGIEQWSLNINYYDKYTPAVNDRYAFVYTGDDDPKLSVIDRINGNIAFEIADLNFNWSGWSPNVAPVIGSRNNIIVAHDNRLLSFDLENRSIGWEITINSTGQPSLANGLIYTIINGNVEVRDERNGNRQWEWSPATGNVTSNLIVTENLLFASTSDTTYAVDLSTHTTVWSYAAGGHLAISDEDALYIATSNGQLIAIDLGTQ